MFYFCLNNLSFYMCVCMSKYFNFSMNFSMNNMNAFILSLPLPTQIIQITHLWVITHRLGTTDSKVTGATNYLSSWKSWRYVQHYEYFPYI